LIMFIGEAIATVVRNHHRHLDRSPTDAWVSVSNPQIISWGCCLNHSNTASCTFSSNMSTQPLRVFSGPKMWKLCGSNSKLNAGCLSTSHHIACSWLCTFWVILGWELLFSGMMLSVRVPCCFALRSRVTEPFSNPV
jgi:hypothetical protein